MSSVVESSSALQLFYSYAHRDEKWLDKIVVHLSSLQQQGMIAGWHGRNINAGTEWHSETSIRLNTAQIILLLISPDFLASDYCQSVEMNKAMERHQAGNARVIPIILRPCDWERTPIGELQVLPRSSKPITRWSNRDEALLQVTREIRRVAEELAKSCPPIQPLKNADQDESRIYRDSVLSQFEQERNRQMQMAPFSQGPVKIDRDMIVSYDLDTQMREFSKRLNFGGAYPFILGGQYNVLRDYIIERMRRELKNKMGRNHRKRDISLLREDVREDVQRVICKKVTVQNQCNTIVDLFREEPMTDVILTIWNHFFPPETTRIAAHFFWKTVSTEIIPYLESTGQCFVVVLANVGEKAVIHQLDHFTLISTPEQFETDHLAQWVSGWLRCSFCCAHR